jgi:hypothetical protein
MTPPSQVTSAFPVNSRPLNSLPIPIPWSSMFQKPKYTHVPPTRPALATLAQKKKKKEKRIRRKAGPRETHRKKSGETCGRARPKIRAGETRARFLLKFFLHQTDTNPEKCGIVLFETWSGPMNDHVARQAPSFRAGKDSAGGGATLRRYFVTKTKWTCILKTQCRPCRISLSSLID